MDENKVLSEMGARITKQRKIMQLTQEDLAGLMEVSPQMISNLEQGKKGIRTENLIKLCSVLKVSADYLLFGMPVNNAFYYIADTLPDLSPEEIKIIKTIIKYMKKNH